MVTSPQLVGQKLSHYHVLEQIGAGGMGVVYRAHDERLDRDVALKVLPRGALSDEHARRQFRREALALAKLNNPNIATIHDFDTQNGVDFLVMECVQGVTLSDHVGKGALPEKQVLALGQQIARALADAHDRRIVHCDLKPRNIMITDGQVKLLDFGLARLLQPGEFTTTESLAEKHIAGTLPYMAPEQLRGEPPDLRSDIYALGVVLFEMATGQRPFQDKSLATLIHNILHRPAPAPRELSQQISLGLQNVILKGLEKDPEMRYQSAREMYVDLRRLSQGDAIALVPPRDRAKRYQKLWVYGISVGLIFCAVAMAKFHFWPTSNLSPRDTILIADFDNRTGEAVLDQVPRELLMNTLEQSHYVSVFPPSRIPNVLRRMEVKNNVRVDEKLAGEICQREGLQGFITGSISRIGKRYVLVVRAVSATGRALATTETAANEEERIPEMIDSAARTLRKGWGESSEEVEKNSLPLAQVTSPSLESVRYYSIGKQQLYAGNPLEAISDFKRALEIDPSFAMAHDYLGVAYQHMGKTSLAGQQLMQATELVGKLTESERYKILGDYALYRRDFDRGIANLQALIAIDPRNVAAHINLGECYVGKFQYDQAIRELEQSARLQPEDRVILNLADAYLMKGDTAHALFLTQGVLRNNPRNVPAREYLGKIQLVSGQLSEARHTLEELLARDGAEESEVRILLADVAMAEGRYQDAEGQLNAGILADARLQNTDGIVRKKLMLTELHLDQGDTRRFVLTAHELESAQSELEPESTVWLGSLYSRAHRPDLVRLQLAALERKVPPDATPTLQSFEHLLRAELARSMKTWTSAVSLAEQATQFENSALALETLGHTYRDAGKLQDAIKDFEQVLLRGNERFDSYDHPAFHHVVEDYYWLAVLCEANGELQKSRDYLEKFLAAWSHPDTGLVMYKDAKRRAERAGQHASSPLNTNENITVN
jgi:serine/threonine protein kinase/tetratricopeptide (TPR) repeat protein